MEINIPDAEGIDEVIERLQKMDREDLLCDAVFHTIATSALFKLNNMNRDEVIAFVFAVAEKIDEAFGRRKKEWS